MASTDTPYLPVNRQHWLAIVGMAVVYFLAGKISFNIEVSNIIVADVIFIPEGLSLAAALLFGPFVWIGVLLGQLALAASSQLSWSIALGIALINSSGLLLTLTFVRKYQLDHRLTTSRDISGILFLIVAVQAAFSATFNNLLLWQADIVSSSELASKWLSWWLANITGGIIIAFTCLTLAARRPLRQFFWQEYLPTIMFTAFFCWAIFYWFRISTAQILMTLTVPMILTITIRLGIQSAMCSICTLTLMSFFLTENYYSSVSRDNYAISLYIFLLGNTLIALFINDYVIERRNVLSATKNTNDRLELAVQSLDFGMWEMDIKTFELTWNERQFQLFGIDPQTPKNQIFAEWRKVTIKEDAEETEALLKRCLENPAERFHGMFRCINPQGEIIYIGFSGSIQYDEKMHPIKFIGMNWDTTESVIAEKTLIESQEKIRNYNERLELANKTIGLGVWEYEYKTQTMICDAQLNKMYWMDENDGDLTYEKWKNIIHPDDLIAIHDQQQAAFEKNETFRGVFRIVNKNGDIKWIRGASTMTKDDSGKPKKIVGVNLDVTDTILAEQSLIENEEKIRKINARITLATQSINFGIWDMDLTTLELIWDDRQYDLFWIDPSTPGNKIYEMWKQRTPPEDVANVEKLLQQCIENPEIKFEGKFRVYSPEGELRWLGMCGIIDYDENGKPARMIGMNWDITKAVLAEQGLKDSQEKLQSIIDAATEFSIITTDLNGTIELFSKGAENMLGYSAAELVGKTSPAIIHRIEEIEERGKALSLQYGRPANIKGFDVFVERAKEGLSEAREWTYVRKDGSTLPVNLIVTALHNSEEKITGFLGIAKDISTEKQAIKTLAKAKEDAEQANIAKSRFLANMSHEIRTPMNAILGMIQLLQNTGLNKRQKDYAEKTQTAAKSLLLILNDILDLSKVEAGKMSLENYPFMLEQLIKEVDVISSVNAQSKNIDFEVNIDNRIPNRLFGDSVRLKQILNNLCGNAIKFTDSGKVLLSLNLVTLNENAASILFSVKDTGIGIAKEHVDKIFDSFSQAESSTTRRFGGTGLGLTISRDLIALMGGSLAVESQPGIGSHFYFQITLFLDNRQEVFVSPGRKLTINRLAGLSLLVAEDNPMNQEIAKEFLIMEGATIELANNGKIALEKLLANPQRYHAVLMDLQMPEMDGISASREIRKHAHLKDLPIIAMTANVMQLDIDNCLIAGMNDHIGKPIDIDILVTTLLKYCRSNTTSSTLIDATGNTEKTLNKQHDTEATKHIQTEPQFADIDSQAALQRIGGNHALYVKLIRLFIQDSGNLLSAYEQQLTAGNCNAAADAMHTLKGLAGTVGLTELSAQANQLEKRLSVATANPADFSESIPHLKQLLSKNITALHALDGKISSVLATTVSSGKTLDKLAISQILIDIDELLETGNMRAIRLFNSLKEQCGSALDEKCIAALESALDQLDFKRALAESRHLQATLDQ